MTGKRRSIIKALTWRTVGMIASALLALLFLGRVDLAIGFVAVETVVKLVLDMLGATLDKMEGNGDESI